MSPRPGPRRPLVAIRLDDAALSAIDAQAMQRGLNRSEQIRLMLAYAAEKLPPNWQPQSSNERADR